MPVAQYPAGQWAKLAAQWASLRRNILRKQLVQCEFNENKNMRDLQDTACAFKSNL